jgi:glycosyltransferase involved in cell wall biosynthesis
VFAVPGDLATPTGGYAYDRRMIAELRALGWRVDVLDLGEGFPRPTEAVRATALASLARTPAGRTTVIDGLAFGVLPEAAEALHRSHPLVALVHHPLALETGVEPEGAAALRRSETMALALARRVITVSAATASVLVADYGVPKDRVTVAPPGTDRVEVGARSNEGPAMLLAVGAVVPRKGYDVLLAALAPLTALDWRLIIVGDRTRSPETAQRLDADIVRLGLAGRVELRGAVTADVLATLYTSADLFVLPSRFEGYGMAYAEAIAHGLPVVGTTAGAIPQTVPARAGVLVPPGDVAALTAVLRRLLENPRERLALAAGARAAAASFPTWPQSAAIFAKALEEVA